MKKTIFILLLFILFLSTLFGVYLPKSKFEKNVIFTVKRGEGIFEISKNLQREGLIRNHIFFEIYVILTGQYKRLQAGKYELTPSMNIPAIARKIAMGDTVIVRVTIPEGFYLSQISEVLLNNGVIERGLENFSVKDFKAKFPFLREIPDDYPLEGFLFPDTYSFNLGMSEIEVVEVFLSNFQKKTKGFMEESEKRGLRFYDVLILASMLEREVKSFDDKRLVAYILLKRLKNNFPLQVDATIEYITRKRTTKISSEDLEIDSPYNTYKNFGLPPTPISNPGAESIKAVLDYQINDYWYYLSSHTGETIFSTTYQEHLLNKEKYLKSNLP